MGKKDVHEREEEIACLEKNVPMTYE